MECQAAVSRAGVFMFPPDACLLGPNHNSHLVALSASRRSIAGTRGFRAAYAIAGFIDAIQFIVGGSCSRVSNSPRRLEIFGDIRPHPVTFLAEFNERLDTVELFGRARLPSFQEA